jgi:hypothetical protein
VALTGRAVRVEPLERQAVLGGAGDNRSFVVVGRELGERVQAGGNSSDPDVWRIASQRGMRRSRRRR